MESTTSKNENIMTRLDEAAVMVKGLDQYMRRMQAELKWAYLVIFVLVGTIALMVFGGSCGG